jgi:hypothetical protein
MNEPVNTPEGSQPAATAQPAAGANGQKPMRAVSDPREVAAVVMARMHQVNARKDELTTAINGLIDITQQLTRTYGEQLIAIEHLRRRVKALEAAAAAAPAAPVQ